MIDDATILVADDSSDDSELLKRALRKAGFTNPVRSFRDGLDLISYLNGMLLSENPEEPFPLLLFLDLGMPRCDGFRTLEWLHEHAPLRSLPTIIFSNSDEAVDIQRSFRSGANGYWIKPSRFEDLVTMVRQLREVLSVVTTKVELEFPMLVAA